jgi:hypothetical protein
MDIYKALALLKDGKLRDCSLDDLRAMSAGAVVFIQNRIPDAVYLKAAVDDEILRKEAQEAERRAEQRHQELVSEQQHLKTAVEDLGKPHWVIWATLVAGAIAAVAAVILLFR